MDALETPRPRTVPAGGPAEAETKVDRLSRLWIGGRGLGVVSMAAVPSGSADQRGRFRESA
jgi:hypothetical protein